MITLCTVSVLSILLCTLYKIAESALLQSSDDRFSENEKMYAKYKKLSHIIANKNLFSHVGRTLSAFFITLCAVLTAELAIPEIITVLALQGNALTVASVIILILSLSVLTAVFGIIARYLPEHIAFTSPEKTLLSILPLIAVLYYLFFPLSKLIQLCARAIYKVLGMQSIEKKIVTEETIKKLVDVSSETGNIETDEQTIIKNIFEFNDLCANDISTHRTGITLLWTHETAEEWEKTITTSRHTYFPICRESVDKVTGVLSSMDYLKLKDRSNENVMKYAVKPPYFVPESAKTNVIFKNMKKSKNYFAIVVDEYGGMSGILTITDLLECIVGDIYSDEETDVRKTPDIEPLDSRMWKVLGCADIDNVKKTLEISFDTDCDTFSGYIITQLGSIPEDGTVTTLENDLMTVKITSIKDHKIEKTMVLLKEHMKIQ